MSFRRSSLIEAFRSCLSKQDDPQSDHSRSEKVLLSRVLFIKNVLLIRRSFQLGINGDRAPCVSVLDMPVEPIILEAFAFESRRLCVAPPVGARGCGAEEIFLLGGAQFRGCAFPGGRRSSMQLPIAWSIMPPETELGDGAFRNGARRGRGEASSHRGASLDREVCENTPLMNYHLLTGGSRASVAACTAIGARSCRDLVGLKVT